MKESSAVGSRRAAGASVTGTFQISPQTLLIAVPDGRCWLMGIGSSEVTALPASAVAAERSTLAASAVEGAIAAGLALAEHTPAAEPYTLLRYIRSAGAPSGLMRRGGGISRSSRARRRPRSQVTPSSRIATSRLWDFPRRRWCGS